MKSLLQVEPLSSLALLGDRIGKCELPEQEHDDDGRNEKIPKPVD